MIKRAFIYLAIALLALTGCGADKARQELIKWQVNLSKEDKRPYGTYLAYQSLKYYFPEAGIEPLSNGFRYDNMDAEMKNRRDIRSLLVLQGLDFYLSGDEWETLKDYINRGNEVVIFCSRLDPKIEDELGYNKQLADEEETPLQAGSSNQRQARLTLANDSTKGYEYKGRSLKGYFTNSEKRAEDNIDSIANDTAIDHVSNDPVPGEEAEDVIKADELGYADGKPDFIRFTLGKGHLTLHAAPLVLSNYFLLQDGNRDYLSGIWQSLPAGIQKIYWNEYYKRTGETSGMSVLWRYPATRLALIVAIIALLMYVLFESKRKQRIIPVIAPLRNDSVSFVETVGRLYYNKSNHNNLAGKMVQQFLEWVRINYFLNTNLLNEQFIQQLVIKSGQPEPTTRGLMDMINEIRMGSAKIDDAYLYQLYNTIEQFYKNKHN